jgi:hypothetical protein
MTFLQNSNFLEAHKNLTRGSRDLNFFLKGPPWIADTRLLPSGSIWWLNNLTGTIEEESSPPVYSITDPNDKEELIKQNNKAQRIYYCASSYI